MSDYNIDEFPHVVEPQIGLQGKAEMQYGKGKKLVWRRTRGDPSATSSFDSERMITMRVSAVTATRKKLRTRSAKTVAQTLQRADNELVALL